MQQFQDITVDLLDSSYTPRPFVTQKGEDSAELMVLDALGRLTLDQIKQIKTDFLKNRRLSRNRINDDDFKYPLASFQDTSGRLLQETTKVDPRGHYEFLDEDHDDWIADYNPVRHIIANYTPSEETRFIDSVYTTEPYKHVSNLTIVIEDKGSLYKLDFGDFYVLHQNELYSKRPAFCKEQNGLQKRNH